MTFEFGGKQYESKQIFMAQLVQEEIFSRKFKQAYDKFLESGEDADLTEADKWWQKKVGLFFEDPSDFSLFKLPLDAGIFQRLQDFFVKCLGGTANE